MDILPAIDKQRHRFAALESELSNPAIYADQRRASDMAREHLRLKKLMEDFDRWQVVQNQIAENEAIAASDDAEMAALAYEELVSLRAESERLTRELHIGLVPPDSNDSHNTIVEIRAGTGGEEAALFAADLYRMYSRYADTSGWKIEVMDTSISERGTARVESEHELGRCLPLSLCLLGSDGRARG